MMRAIFCCSSGILFLIFEWENLTFEEGKIWLQKITEFFPDLQMHFDKFRAVDSVGSPRVFFYGEAGAFSPSTLRLIALTGELKQRLYHAQEGLVNFDSARHSQIEAKRSDRESHSKTMAAETRRKSSGLSQCKAGERSELATKKDRFGKVAASQNSPNLTERGIGHCREWAFAPHRRWTGQLV